MKGIELPINILIIIAIAVIVLIALVAMFYPAFSSGSQSVSLETAKTQACRSLIGNNCNSTLDPNYIYIYNFDADKDGQKDPGSGQGASCPTTGALPSNDNLYMLCRCYYQTPSMTDCKKLCGC